MGVEGMAKKIGKIALIAIVIILFVYGYYMNLMAIVAPISADSMTMTVLLSSTLIFTLVYLFFWLFMQFRAYKRDSKEFLNMYCIFWATSTTCIALLMLGIYMLWIPGFLFYVPLSGFDTLAQYINHGWFGASPELNMHFALAISVIMFLVGFVARIKWGTKK